MGQTRVDLRHLLEDLRDAYPGELEETILSEIVANALDSGATGIRVLADPEERTLVVVDDGSGMGKRQLARYHDLATTSKSRGEGIGFAGVGIKLGLLGSNEDGGPGTATTAGRPENLGPEGPDAASGSAGSDATQSGETPAPAARVATGVLPPSEGPGGRGSRRRTRYGLSIEFEERPDSPELGRLVESTVLVNTAHAAYRRAVASRSEGYHVALTVGLALAAVAVEPASAHVFLSSFLACWGNALGRDKRRRKERPRTGRGS